MAYALTWDSGHKNLMVATAADLEGAKAAVDGARATAGIAAAAPEDLDLSGGALVALYGALASTAGVEGPSPTRFATKGDGQRRVFGLLDLYFKNAAAAAPPAETNDAAAETGDATSTETTENDVTTKGKKAKKTGSKKPVTKKAPREKKVRKFKDTVASKGGEKSKAAALEMIQRKMGATAQEIADKLELSLGSAKNLVWYLRRDGHKIVVNKDSDRKPYVI